MVYDGNCSLPSEALKAKADRGIRGVLTQATLPGAEPTAYAQVAALQRLPKKTSGIRMVPFVGLVPSSLLG